MVAQSLTKKAQKIKQTKTNQKMMGIVLWNHKQFSDQIPGTRGHDNLRGIL